MAIYIKPEDFPKSMTGKNFRKRVKESTGMTDREIKDAFQETDLEKQVVGGMSNRNSYIGSLEISGAYFLNSKLKIAGSLNTKSH